MMWVLRGNSWGFGAVLCRSVYRDCYEPNGDNSNIGFRIAKRKELRIQVLRGGSWHSIAAFGRAMRRGYGGTGGRHLYLGFRLAKRKR